MGNLEIAQSLVLPQHHDLLLFRLERRQRSSDPQRTLSIGCGGRQIVRQRFGAAADAASTFHEQEVVGNSEQVRAKGGAWLVAPGALQDGEEDVLHQFFGASRIVEATAIEAPDGFLVALEQRLERGPRAASRLEHERFVVHMPGTLGYLDLIPM